MNLESMLDDVLETTGLPVYGVRSPDEVTFPYITFLKVSPGRVYSHCGYSNIARPRYQINIYARTYHGVKVAAATVLKAIEDGFPGSTLTGEIDGELDGTYRIIQDFFINFKED